MHQFVMSGHELTITKDGECIHIFKKDDRMSWVQYKHMIEWIKIYTQPDEDHDVIWSKAMHAWNSLSVEVQAFLAILG